MSNGTAESRKGEALLEDVDADTFSRFTEWLYTGSYSPVSPETTGKKNFLTPTNDSKESFFDDGKESFFDESDSEPDTNLKPESAEEMLKSMDNFSSIEATAKGVKLTLTDGRTILSEETSYKGPFLIFHASSPVKDAALSYSKHFLIHAILYVFAEKKKIKQLQIFAAKSLAQSLRQFSCYKERAIDIIDLASYIYSNTPDLRLEPDQLRQIVTDCAAEHFRDLMSTPEFRSLIGKGGRLVEDVCYKASMRLPSDGSSLQQPKAVTGGHMVRFGKPAPLNLASSLTSALAAQAAGVEVVRPLHGSLPDRTSAFGWSGLASATPSTPPWHH